MKQVCSQCNSQAGPLFEIDGKQVCHRCLYGDTEPVQVYPIGHVRNTQSRAEKGFGVDCKSNVSAIELFPSQKPFMYKLEDEEKIMVIYYLHKKRPVRSVFNRGLDGKKVGVFASRTPDRLSGLAVQDVRLVKIDGTTLYVEGLDAIDGSPVLDIKMYWQNRLP